VLECLVMPYYQRNLIVLAFTVFLAAVSWNQIMPFLPLFLNEMGVPRSQLFHWVGIIFSIQAMASIVAAPFWGKMGDRFGRKPMTIRAGICLAVIYFTTSIVRTPLQLVVVRFFNGALTGFIPGSMAIIATNTPRDKAPKSIAWMQTFIAAGQIAGPAIGGILVGMLGFRMSMRVSGIATLFGVLLVVLLVQERNKTELAEPTSILSDVMVALRSPVLSSVMLTIMLYGICVAAILPMLSLHIKSIYPAASMKFIGVVFSLPPLALVITAHVWAYVGRRWGYDRGIVTGLIGACTCVLILALTRNIWLFVPVFFLMGAFLSGLNTSTPALIALRVKEHFRGRAYGMELSASTLGAFISPLIAGAIATAYGSRSVFLFVAASYVVGIVLFPMMVRRWHTEPDDAAIPLTVAEPAESQSN